jgi:hypothetical protein
MARSQTQGYQIAVVLLLILWVLTCVMAVVFARKYNTAYVQSEKDRADAQKNLNAVRGAEEEMSRLKQWMGYEPTASISDVEKTAKADFDKYAATLPEAQRTYRSTVEALWAAVTGAEAALKIAQAEVQSLKDRNEAREAAKDKQIAEHRQQLEKAHNDLAAEKAKYEEARIRLETQNNQYAQQIKQLTGDLDTLRTQYEQDMSKARQTDQLRKQELKDRDRTIALLRGETPAAPDGVIREVNHRARTVWINLGEADGLKRQVTFSVYGRDQNGVAKGKRKAAIEVTRVLEPHLAEANIIEDDFTDPIVKGDQIYTPLWQPRRPERFALAGFLDIDGDNQSDREMVRELISINGGLIDAEVDDAGKETGQMTLDTRYLVVGQENDLNIEKLGQMKARAEELGVEILSLPKFLDHVGWKNTNRVLRYGSDQYRNFQPPTPDGGRKHSTGITSEQFRPRQLGQKKFSEPQTATPQPARP